MFPIWFKTLNCQSVNILFIDHLSIPEDSSSPFGNQTWLEYLPFIDQKIPAIGLHLVPIDFPAMFDDSGGKCFL